MSACEECCRNCRLAHGKNKDLSPSVSRFIKIFFGDDVSNFLRVPPTYTNTISHLAGKDAKLEDSTGAQWTVSLSNYMGVLVFHNGWAKFVADHELQLGDILVFHYFNFSVGHFVVQIFERKLVEKTEFANKIHLVKDSMTTENIQRNATNGVSSRSIDRSRQARSGKNLSNARTSLEMGHGDNGFTDSEETAADTTPFQGNDTEGVSFKDIGPSTKQARTSLEMGERDNVATKGVGFKDVGRSSKRAKTILEMGERDNGATNGVGFRDVCPPSIQARKVCLPSKQGRTCLEMGDGDNDATDTEKIAADTTPFQGNATNGVSSRSVDNPSRQVRPSRNLNNASTGLEMGGDNGATDTVKFAADTSPFQGNATKDRPSKQERTDINLDNAKTCLELDGGDIRTADTSEFNRESSRTSIESNFETPLIQPSTSYCPLQPKSGNEEQPCLDDASCVIIDRSTYFAETEKKVVLYDLSVYERQNREPISDKSCIDGDEVTHSRAQKFEVSMAEANNSGTGFINRMTVSKVPKTGMVQDTKASGHMDTSGTGFINRMTVSKVPKTGMVQDMKASGHLDTTGNCSKSYLGRGNCSESPLGNWFTSPISRQVHTKDTHNEMKVVKKEQATLREEASDHIRKPQDPNPSWIWKAEGPPISSLKRKAAKLEPEDSLDEPSLFPDSITCSAGTDNCDYIKLPTRLPSVVFKKGKGRIDNRCSILLIDPEKRKWPAIYLDKFGSFFGVICGWKQFNKANKVLPGDSYVFSLDNKSECRFKVDVVRM